MFYRKSYPKLIQVLPRIYGHNRYSLAQNNHVAYICNLMNKNAVCFDCNVGYNSKSKILQSVLRFSTNPIEVPYSLPPPIPESDKFGSLGGLKYENVELDAEELKEEERLKNIGGQVPRKNKPYPGQYAKMIKNYIDNGDLKSAEEVIEECKRNRDKPTPYMYTLLMRALALQGDVQKCYKYYADMKTRNYKIKNNAFISLLNACANSPDSEKALKYLHRIKDYMAKINFSMNHAHYNVLIKAYGRHNKIEDANKVLHEMIKKKMKIGVSSYNSLMYAANSDVKSGLKYIIFLWQMMRKEKIPPDIFSYNLLLRGIRDTNFGNCSVNDLLLPDVEYPVILTDDNRPDLLIYPPVLSSLPLDNIQKKSTVLLNSPNSNIPESQNSIISDDTQDNLEILPPAIANLDLDAVLKQNKLILFGGVDGFIQKMKADKIQPNIKTLTYLMQLVPDSIAAEESIIKLSKSQKIPLDIEFFNILIKKRCLRDAKDDAKALIQEIHKFDLKPNIVTYGVLALACKTTNESRDLLQTMKSTGLVINKYVADVLLCTAFTKMDFIFILELMEKMRRERVRLDESTFIKLDEFQMKMTEYVKTKQRYAQTDKFKVGFSKFNMRYKTWLESMGRKVITERESKKV